MRRRQSRFLFAALAFVLSGTALAEDTAPAAPAAPATPAAPASVPADQKILRVATSGDYAPFSFESAASPNGLDGFDVEVASRFAKDLGYRVEIVRFRWPELSKQLAAGSFDVAMSGVTVRAERAISGRLSVPVAATQAVALSWKGSGITKLAELDKPTRRISVNAGGHLEKVTQQFFRRAEVLPIADNAAVRMALLDRTVDGVVTDNFEEKVWMAGAPDAVHLGSLSNDRKAYLLPAGKAELAAELDRWLLAREKDGTLAGLRKRYFRNADGSEVTGGDETLPAAAPVEGLAAVVRERVGIMPFVYEAKKRDGKPIEDKVQEAAVLDGAARAVAAEATALSAAPPDEQAVRALVEILMEIGKDAQQKVADTEARQRPGTIVRRSGSPEPEAPQDPEQAAKEMRTTGPDLAKDLRPALARIGEKIARILVAMDEPVSARSARATLEASLESQGVKSDRIDALADAVARVSKR